MTSLQTKESVNTNSTLIKGKCNGQIIDPLDSLKFILTARLSQEKQLENLEMVDYAFLSADQFYPSGAKSILEYSREFPGFVIQDKNKDISYILSIGLARDLTAARRYTPLIQYVDSTKISRILANFVCSRLAFANDRGDEVMTRMLLRLIQIPFVHKACLECDIGHLMLQIENLALFSMFIFYICNSNKTNKL